MTLGSILVEFFGQVKLQMSAEPEPTHVAVWSFDPRQYRGDGYKDSLAGDVGPSFVFANATVHYGRRVPAVRVSQCRGGSGQTGNSNLVLNALVTSLCFPAGFVPQKMDLRPNSGFSIHFATPVATDLATFGTL